MSVTDPSFNPSGSETVSLVKTQFQALEEILKTNIEPGRRLSIALTHLETAAMYAVKAAVVGDK